MIPYLIETNIEIYQYLQTNSNDDYDAFEA